MKLLICTQAVDQNDPALGFFHEWIARFAREADKVTVICLRKGEYDLPGVEVIALGERHRLFRALELLSLSLGRQRDYDAIFVHMNPEYVVAAGWLWRMLGKNTALWYTHKSVDLKLRIAEKFAHVILTASKESFRLPTKKVRIMGHGIDTDFFRPDPAVIRGNHLLSVGRLMKSKRHDLAIKAARIAGRTIRIAGEGEERGALQQLAREEGADVVFLGGLSQEKLRDEYRKAAHLLHTSETGGLDKVVLEAAACDCNVITTVNWMHREAPVHSVDSTPEAIADAINHDVVERRDRVDFIKTKHSLTALIPQILWTLSKNK